MLESHDVKYGHTGEMLDSMAKDKMLAQCAQFVAHDIQSRGPWQFLEKVHGNMQ